MESTRKFGQDRYFLKILTFWSIFVQKSTFGNWTFTQFLSFEWRNGSQNRNVLEKLSGTGPFWKFWLFGQGQGSTKSKHFLSFFFFFAGGSDRVRFPGRSNRLVGVTSSMTSCNWVRLSELGAWTRVNELPAREELWLRVRTRRIDAGDRRTFWESVAARPWSLGPEIFRFCRSGHGGSPGIVRFLKFRMYLHRSEGLSRWSSRVCGGAWMCVQPLLGLKF